MNKLIIMLIFWVLSAFNTLSEQPKEIKWSKDFKLKKEHFVLVDELPDNKIAIINSGFTMNSNYNSVFAYRAYALMDTKQSFLLKSCLNNPVKLAEIFNHEMGHFNINQYIVIKLNSQLVDVHDFRQANDLYSSYTLMRNILQDLYDKETDGHNNKEMQLYWDNKIKDFLK